MTEHDLSESADRPSPPPNCPKCDGPMWDNREGKRNPKAPDFKCKDKGCDGVIWPPRGAAGAKASPSPAPQGQTAPAKPARGDSPACPICGGPMWDDRASKRNPRAPDFKCKNKPRERGGPGCEGVIWPPRPGARSGATQPARPSGSQAGPGRPRSPAPPDDVGSPFDEPPPHDDDDLPF